MKKFDVKPIEDLMDATGDMIDESPLMQAGNRIAVIKQNFEDIQSTIKKKGLSNKEKQGIFKNILARMAGGANKTYTSFDGKITAIFTDYDMIKANVDNNVEMYSSYAEGLIREIDRLKKFMSKVEEKDLTDDDVREFRNYVVMLENLELTLKRVNLNKTSSEQLAETMRVSKPIFKTILKSCMIEVAGQVGIDASAQIMDTITSTIEGLTNNLTDASAKSAQMALKASTQPALASVNIEKNMKILLNVITDLENQSKKLIGSSGVRDDMKKLKNLSSSMEDEVTIIINNKKTGEK